MEIRERISSSLWMLFVSYVTAMDSSLSEIERHLEMGKLFLSKGQFSDSLTHYHAAVELDPKNYQTLYRRATVYLAMGKSKSALPDLNQVVQLKPDFVAARVQRGNVLLKQGNLDEAENDYRAVIRDNPDHAEALEKLNLYNSLRDNIENGLLSFEEEDFNSAEFYLTKAIEICQWYPNLYEKRSECYEHLGQVQKAIADIRVITKLVADSTEAYFRISILYYHSGNIEESLTQVRECLKLNPDHDRCFPHYKKVKKLFKMQETMKEFVQRGQWMECLKKAEQIFKFETQVEAVRDDVFKVICKCHLKANHIHEAIETCSQALEASDESDLLCDRAEAFILNDQFQEAIQDFQRATNDNNESRRANEGLDRAQKLLKQSQRKDYYKILDVRRSAVKRDILRAYRKMAQKWHPDNFADEVEKKKAQNKFIEIAAAKEVLTDPEKRERFDRGEDPLDPEQQQQQHPFYHGGGPFGGGGESFTFKFNFG